MSYADDLKKRMELARQQGWSEDEVQRSALIDRSINTQKEQKAKQATQKQQQQKAGVFNAGAAPGFIMSLLPFGEVLRKKLNNEEFNPGDVALDAALSALPFAGKLLAKGGKAVAGVVRGAEATKKTAGATKIAKTAEDVPEKNKLIEFLKGNPNEGGALGQPTLASGLTKTGAALKAEARGVKPAIKPIGGSQPLYSQGVKDVSDTLNNVERKAAFGRTKKGTSGSATKQLEQVETAQKKAGIDIETAFAKRNPTYKSTDLQKTNDAALKDIIGDNGSGVIEMKKQHNDILTEMDKKIAGIKDARGANELKKEMAGKIKFNRDSASPDVTKERIYEIYRRKLDDLVNSASPDVKKANTAYSKLDTAKNVVVQNTPGNLKQAGNAGPGSRLINNSLTQNAVDKAGRVLTRAGKIQASPITHQLEMHAPFSAAGAIGASQSAPEVSTEFADIFPDTQDPNEATINQLFAAGVTDPQEITDALVGQGKYSPETAQAMEGAPSRSQEYADAAYQAIQAGDIKTAKAYMDFAETAAKLEKSSGGGAGKPLSAEASKVLANANSGLDSLSQLEAIIKKEGGVSQGTLVPGRELFGNFGANALGTASFDTAAKNVTDVITRLRTGAALTESEEKFYKSQIPQAFDTPEVRAQKIDMFRNLFDSIASRTGNSSMDISELFKE